MLKKIIRQFIFTVLVFTSALALSAQSALASDWVEEGWLHIEQNDVESALAVWQNGVNALPASQLLIFTGLYVGPGDAVRQLKRAGKDHRAIILQADFKGESAYYVMSAVDVPADRQARRQKLAGLRKAINASSWLSGNAAKKFQSATATIESDSTTVAAEPVADVSDEETFPINSFEILGNTLVSSDVIRNGLSTHLGPRQSRADLFRARQTIIELYQKAGFDMVAVGLPGQNEAGTITLRIFEDDIQSPVAAAAATIPEKPAVQAATPLSTDWIQQGWQAIDQADIATALTAWQQGVNSLPSSKLLIFAGVYVGTADALKQLKRAGRDQDAIILKSDFNGKQAYYVMSAVDVPADKTARREKLTALREAINAPGWLYGNEAGKFQTAVSPLAKAQEAEPKPATFAIKKEPIQIREKTFPIDSFDIQGNTLISNDEIQRSLAIFVGTEKTRADLIMAKRAIIALYRRAGFEMVAVGLPRRIKSATIPLRVVEVSIGEITVSGDTYRSEEEIIAMLPGLRSGTVANSAELKKQLEKTGKQSNIKSARLVYHPTAQGTVNVEVVIDEVNPLKLGFMASNLGTKEAGRTLFTGFLYHNNLWNMGHEITLSYTKSERINNLQLYSGLYEIPIQQFDGKLKFGVTRANLSNNQIAPVLLASGVSLIKAIHYEQQLYRTATMYHYIDIGYEIHRFDQMFQNTILALPLFSIRTDAKPVIASYGFKTETASGDYNFKASYLYNSPGGTFNNDATYQLVNVASKARFRMLRIDADYSYAWLNGWTFSASLAAQKTNHALISGEHFFLTGMDRVRGFAQDDASGDSGILVRTELTTPAWLDSTRFHVFMDGGHYELNFPLPLELKSDNIASAGLGLQWRPKFGLDVRLEGGIVIDGTRLVRPGSAEGHFKVIYWFM